MKLKATKGFCLGAGRDVAPGDVFEASDRDAAIHIQKGRAVLAEEAAAKPAKAKPAKAKPAKAKPDPYPKGGE